MEDRVNIGPEEITAVCDKIIELIQTHYVEDARTPEIIVCIQDNLREGHYRELCDYAQLAKRLTNDLRSVSQDSHLYLEVAPMKEKGDDVSQDVYHQAELGRERELNFGFTELSVLQGNVGYLKIEEFMNPDRSIDVAIAAMKFLENTSSLIIDLRQNGGGYGGVAEYLASYFFAEEPTLLSTSYYKEKELTAYQTFSYPFVVGKRCLAKPLFLLVDEKTGSAAEWFAYTLQSFKKGIVVGEVSRGGANRNDYFEVNPHLRLSLSVGKVVSAATNGDWEGKGVIPDIYCVAHEAKTRAWQEATKDGE